MFVEDGRVISKGKVILSKSPVKMGVFGDSVSEYVVVAPLVVFAVLTAIELI